MSKAFDFIADMSILDHINAQCMVGEMPTALYFLKPCIMAFHNLSNNKSILPATTAIMQLGTKFIPNLDRTLNRSVVKEALEHFERHLGLKVYFASLQEDKNKTSKLYVKSI